MRTYRNNLAATLYPFKEYVPIPIGTISYISINTDLDQPVYVTSVSSMAGAFSLSVGSQNGSCTFKYDGSTHISSTNNNNMFGILQLASQPVQAFKYIRPRGAFGLKLHQSCIQRTLNTGGYTQITLNGVTTALQTNALNIVFKGSVDTDVTRMKVTRITDPCYSMGDIKQSGKSKVQKINNYKVTKLNIVSANTDAIQINNNYLASDKGIATLYINTGSSFPVCQDQRNI